MGADLANDLRRGRLIRSIVDDPQHYPSGDPDPARLSGCPALVGKNAGPTGAVLMIDANQVWDVQQAIDYVSSLRDQVLVRARRGLCFHFMCRSTDVWTD